MYKKMLSFYLGAFIISVVNFFTFGGGLGWMATESGSVELGITIGVLSLVAELFITYMFLDSSFNNFDFSKWDILKFLIPYFVLIGIYVISIILLVYDVFEFIPVLSVLINASLGLLFVFALPSIFPAMMFSGAFEYSEIAVIVLTLFITVIHIIEIVILMEKCKRKKRP